MKLQPPAGIKAHIHPDLFPYGNIEDGSTDDVVAAENWLRDHGCTHARGPMGPTTWHPYRAIVDSDGRPLFLGETEFSPFVWESRGYSVCAHYASALASNTPQIESAEARSESLRMAGWVIKNLQETGGFQSALRCFHSISISAFENAFAYTPLNLNEFERMYTPIEPLIEPKLVLTAISPSGEPGGFCFGIPDRLNPETRQFIIKTLAVSAEYRHAGIGSWLTATAHQQAHDLGCTEGGIHALMWTDSHSRQISQHAGKIFRRYALYEKKL